MRTRAYPILSHALKFRNYNHRPTSLISYELPKFSWNEQSKVEKMSNNKIIKIQTIHSRIRKCLDPKNQFKVFHDDLISKFILGGAPTIRAFIDVLNKYPPFKKDGLNLVPADVLKFVPNNDATKMMVHHLTRAVRHNYEARTWKISH